MPPSETPIESACIDKTPTREEVAPLSRGEETGSLNVRYKKVQSVHDELQVTNSMNQKLVDEDEDALRTSIAQSISETLDQALLEVAREIAPS